MLQCKGITFSVSNWNTNLAKKSHCSKTKLVSQTCYCKSFLDTFLYLFSIKESAYLDNPFFALTFKR